MENFSNLMPRLELFENINGALKEVRMALCRADVFYDCNILLVYLNSKFDELKEFH